MGINPKIKILGRGKLSRINEINLNKIKRGQNPLALNTRESLRWKFSVFLVCCGGATRPELATSSVTGGRAM